MPTLPTRWDPFTELRTRFDRMFDDVAGHERTWTPAISGEHEDSSVVELRIPLPDEAKKEPVTITPTAKS